MQLNLKNRTAIVTGGSRGIGKEITRGLLKEGTNVMICARNVKDLEMSKQELDGLGGHIEQCPADVTDTQSVKTMVKKTISLFKGIDILITAAGGISTFGNFTQLSDEDWNSAYSLNVMSTVMCIRETLPWLLRSKAPRVVTISSLAGAAPGTWNPHYSAAKAAVINITKHVANAYAPQGVLANTICVGPVHSDLWEKNISYMADLKQIPYEEARQTLELQEAAKVRLGRIGEGSDVAGMVTFLASDEAKWITGACFYVDGGKHTSMI